MESEKVIPFGVGGDPPGGCVRRYRGYGRPAEVVVSSACPPRVTANLEPGAPTKTKRKFDLSALANPPVDAPPPAVPQSEVETNRPPPSPVHPLPPQPSPRADLSPEEQRLLAALNAALGEDEIYRAQRLFVRMNYKK